MNVVNSGEPAGAGGGLADVHSGVLGPFNDSSDVSSAGSVSSESEDLSLAEDDAPALMRSPA